MLECKAGYLRPVRDKDETHSCVNTDLNRSDCVESDFWNVSESEKEFGIRIV